jgi:hypothetical protein
VEPWQWQLPVGLRIPGVSNTRPHHEKLRHDFIVLYRRQNGASEYLLQIRHILSPWISPVLIGPFEHLIIIRAHMFRSPARSSVRFPFQSRVCPAHEGLPDVVEAVGGVMPNFLCQRYAAPCDSVVLSQI